jgi:hypothetical protein
MRYKILYTKNHGPQMKISVIDFKKGQIITFTVAEFDELEDDLKEYIRNISKEIKSGYYNYTG